MKKMSSIKIIAAFSIVVFLTVLFALILVGCFFALSYHLGILHRPNPILSLILLGAISVAISTILAGIIGKKGMSPIIRVTEATKEIAKGNYEVKVDEKIWFEEIREMAHNFNFMAQELGNTETFRNDFINNVSHEFKTPISAIEGYAMLLQNKNISLEEQEDYILRILKNTKRLSSLTGNILQLSNLENQDRNLLVKEFSLDEQLRQIVLLSEPEWTDKNIDLDIDLEENVILIGNENLLAQVWQNIFGNAVKFTPPGGMVKVMLRTSGADAIVSITDKGAGMPEKVTERIFEKFYQGDKSHSSEGNGLGLTLAKRIVDLHNGKIKVFSEEGKGSTFIIELPLQQNV